MTDSEQLILAIERCLFNQISKNECKCNEVTEKFIESRLSGYKAQVAGQAHYIKCLLDEVRELKERIQEFAKGA